MIVGGGAASGMIIATSQLKHILGISASGHNLLDLALSLISHIGEANLITFSIGAIATVFLFWVRKGLKPLLIRLGLPQGVSDIAAKAGPVAAVAVTTLLIPSRLVHRRIQKIQMTMHYLFGFASTLTNRPDRSVCVDALEIDRFYP